MLVRLVRICFGCAVVMLAGIAVAGPAKLSGVSPAVSSVHTAKEAGLLESLEVAVGDEVKQGQILAKLDHARQLTAFLSAKMRAESRHGIDIAEGMLREKNAHLSLVLAQQRRRQTSDEEVEKAQGQAQVARGQLAAARLAMEIAKLELTLAEQLLEARYIRAQISGTVAAVACAAGARINQGDIVLTVSDLTQLKSGLMLPRVAAESLSVGSTIPLRLAGSEIVHLAKIGSISPVEGSKDGAQNVTLLFENMGAVGTDPSRLALEAILPDGIEPLAPPAPDKNPVSKPPAPSGGKR